MMISWVQFLLESTNIESIMFSNFFHNYFILYFMNPNNLTVRRSSTRLVVTCPAVWQWTKTDFSASSYCFIFFPFVFSRMPLSSRPGNSTTGYTLLLLLWLLLLLSVRRKGFRACKSRKCTYDLSGLLQ